MVDPLPPPPEPVQQAARIVEQYLAGTFTAQVQGQGQQAPGPGPARKATDAEFAAMTPAERLDYARCFDQQQFHSPPEQRTRYGKRS